MPVDSLTGILFTRHFLRKCTSNSSTPLTTMTATVLTTQLQFVLTVSSQYYIHILCLALDRVLHTRYVIACECAKAKIGLSWWSWYLSKHNGRHDFQIDLGIVLLNRAIQMDWNGIGPKPKWMRQTALIPGDCKCAISASMVLLMVYQPTKNNAVLSFTTSAVSLYEFEVVRCTNVRVKVCNNQRYCIQCYKNHPGVDENSNKINSTQKKNKCKQSYLGCGSCLQPICAACWPTYDHCLAK